MRINVKKTRQLVDRFQSEIRKNADIILEDIAVKEIDFSKTGLFADCDTITPIFTEQGRIYVDPSVEYNPDAISIEYVVLHELGHKAQKAFNPVMHFDIIEVLTGFRIHDRNVLWRSLAFMKLVLEGKELVGESLNEGLANCFALDIFPDFCNISKEGIHTLAEHRSFRKELIENPRIDSRRKCFAQGYNFFSSIYRKHSLPGVISYVRNISGHRIPSFKEMAAPKGFLDKEMPEF